MENKSGLEKILGEIQANLIAPKGQWNGFGKYKYRSCEDILEAVKPLLAEKNVTLTISDDMILLGNRYYVKATATLSNDMFTHKDEPLTIQVTAFARESETKKGMDDSQITGAASSYARKYALNGLLLIDDNKDADTQDNKKPSTEPKKQQTTNNPPQQTQEPDKNIISEPQRKRLYAIGKSNGWQVEEMKELVATFGYAHSKDIKREDYKKICDMLEKGLAPKDKREELLDKIKKDSDKNIASLPINNGGKQVKKKFVYEKTPMESRILNLKNELHDDIKFGTILMSSFGIEEFDDLSEDLQKEFAIEIEKAIEKDKS